MHIPSGFSIPAISSFRSIKNSHGLYRGNDCVKSFCEFLGEHAMEIFNFKKKIMKLLTKEQQESYQNAKAVVFVKKN